MKSIRKTVLVLMSFMAVSLTSCDKTLEFENRLEDLDKRVAAMEELVAGVNDDIIAARKIFNGKTVIVGYEDTENGWVLSLDDGTKVTVTKGTEENGIVPVIGIDKDGKWTVSLDGGKSFAPIAGAGDAFQTSGATPQVKVDAEGFWVISLDGGKEWKPILDGKGQPVSAVDGTQFTDITSFFTDVTLKEAEGKVVFTLADGQVVEVPFCNDFDIRFLSFPAKASLFLGQTQAYEVELTGVAKVMIQVPEGWEATLSESKLTVTAPATGTAGEYTINLIAQSEKNYLKVFPVKFTLVAEQINPANCKTWNDYKADNSENVLLDYSYAGYNHGETAPVEASATGYKVYDVRDYGAVPNDGLSDRDAFLECLKAAVSPLPKITLKNITFTSSKPADAIIYFPEGEFILHTSADDVEDPETGKMGSRTIQICADHVILKGAGRDKTVILMQDPNLPTDENVLYSSPVMIEMKHNSGLGTGSAVTGSAEKGTFSVEVASAAAFKAGDWVCLDLKDNNPTLVAEELAPYSVESRMTDIRTVKVNDYHQISKIEGNKVTFVEPIMRAVDPKYAWTLKPYKHYDNCGIEDLTFKGNAKDRFIHHSSWEDDGAYKPLNMARLTNSWIRRVRFTSVSEGCSITMSSNISAYDIIFDGNRGHASVRSAGSSRVFIGATIDLTSGYKHFQNGNLGEYMENAGNYHAVGVSKPSMGAVLWRNVWGNDSCFESHASQPRATLIDCCRGGWMRWRQGGAEEQVPNHLGDLTIWNFNATTPYDEGVWDWWDAKSLWWKFVMPVVVGFHGQTLEFNTQQMKGFESNGIPVNPESLYEAQLADRLGAVPAWLIELKK